MSREGLSDRYFNRMEKRKNLVQDANAEREVYFFFFLMNKIFFF
jgi:hypothetical protein